MKPLPFKAEVHITERNVENLIAGLPMLTDGISNSSLFFYVAGHGYKSSSLP